MPPSNPGSSGPVADDAIAALDRIGFLLERSQAPTYRVKAFRRAASAIASLTPAELAHHIQADTLQTLPGVGEVTERVITEALAGRVPEYLSRLEAELRPSLPLVEGGANMRGLLRGDCHTHSDWSDGGSPIEVMANVARELGHDYIVLTDHSARLTVAHGLSRQRLLHQLEVVAELNAELTPFRILTGMEVDILENGSLDADDDILARLDVVVASVHSKLKMEAGAMTRRMICAVASPHVDILGHCTGRLVNGKRSESQFDPDMVFAACARTDTAVEINCRPERLDPPRRLLRLAVEWGCRFSIDTDAHAPGQLDWQAYGCARAEECQVDPARVVNTLPANELLDWATTHAA